MTSHSTARLYTAEQVRGLDHAAIHGLGIAGYDLMQRAGRAVTEAARGRFPQAHNWLILCGPGNNGGDGYVVARLAREAGFSVSVCALSDPDKLQGDAARACADWQQVGGRIATWPFEPDERFDLALDALLGTGISRDVGGDYRQAIDFLNGLACPRVAIDIPSGLNADTGCVMGCCVRAALSVTFVGRKRGMYTADGPDHCGQIVFDDLGVPAEAAREVGPGGELLLAQRLATVLAPRPRNVHKGRFGHLLVVGGQRGMSGAVRLCGEAALRSGAGLVTLATDPAHAAFVNAARPELMVRAVAGADELKGALEGSQVLAVGPGLGRSDWSRSLLKTCIDSGLPLVIDADGLNLLAEFAVEGWLDSRLHEGHDWILTPHPAEAGRLLSCTTDEVQLDRVSVAQRLAKRFEASVVLKGCGTVVAGPGAAYAICPHGNPGMATAGSGDVLTGIIAALLGQGLERPEAARCGVLAHALAGDEAAARLGEMAMVAGDLTQNLSAVWSSALPPGS